MDRIIIIIFSLAFVTIGKTTVLDSQDAVKKLYYPLRRSSDAIVFDGPTNAEERRQKLKEMEEGFNNKKGELNFEELINKRYGDGCPFGYMLNDGICKNTSED